MAQNPLRHPGIPLSTLPCHLYGSYCLPSTVAAQDSYIPQQIMTLAGFLLPTLDSETPRYHPLKIFYDP